jgi:hypothetical protein
MRTMTRDFKCIYCNTRTTLLKSVGQRACSSRHSANCKERPDRGGVFLYPCCGAEKRTRTSPPPIGCVHSDHVHSEKFETIKIPLWLVKTKQNSDDPEALMSIPKERTIQGENLTILKPGTSSIDFEKSYLMVRVFDVPEKKN